MAVIGFDLNKISAHRKNKISGKVDIKTKINITNVSEEKVELVKDKDVLKFNFDFNIGYEPELASIDFQGFVLMISDPKASKEILKLWKNKKQVDAGFKTKIYNVILQKCNLKAFQLEEELSLPTHFPIPMFKSKPEPANYTN